MLFFSVFYLICCEFFSQPALNISPTQLLIGGKERQAGLLVEHNTLHTMLLNHTEEEGAEERRLGDELCTHAVLVSFSIHAQRNNQTAATQSIKLRAHCLLQ